MTTVSKAVQLICILSILIGLSSCSTEKKYDILITNTSVINVENGSIAQTDLAILDNRIIKIEKNIPEKESNQIVDGSGKYIIPALWDMHVHFEAWDYEPMAKLMIANGVLGARDMGGNDLNRLDAMRAKLGNQIPNMRIIRPGRMLDGQTPGWPFRITVTDSISAKKAVDDNVNLEVDFIKVHQQLNKESFLAIAKRAREKNIPFFGHVPHRVGGELASNEGQRSFEHLTGTPNCLNDDCSNIQKNIDLYRKNKTFQTPTLTIYNADVKTFNNQKLSKEFQSYLNSSVKKEWKMQDSINKQFLPPLDQMPDLSIARANSFYQVAKKMFAENLDMVAGTDAGFVGVIPGFDLHTELELMVNKAGATNLQALQSATFTAVKMMNLKNQGTIESGNYADLLILNENPLGNISATRSIEYVISNGEILTKKQLQQLKDECKNENKN